MHLLASYEWCVVRCCQKYCLCQLTLSENEMFSTIVSIHIIGMDVIRFINSWHGIQLHTCLVIANDILIPVLGRVARQSGHIHTHITLSCLHHLPMTTLYPIYCT